MNNLFKKLKWIYHNCKFTTPIIISLIIIGSIISLSSVGKSLATRYLIDSSTIGNSKDIKKWVIILGILLLLSITLSIIQTLVNTYCYEKLKNKMQEKLYNNIIISKWKNITKYHSVDLLTRISNDVNTICNVIVNILPEIISLSVMLIASFIALLSISKPMSILAIVMFPVLILLSKIYGKKLQYFYIELQKKESKYSKFLQESFNNILIVKSFCLEKSRKETLKEIQDDKLKFSMKKSLFGSVSNGFLSFSSLIGYFAVLVWGSMNLNNNVATFGSLTAMLQLFSSVQAPIYGLSSSLPKIISAFGAVNRLKEIEDVEHEEYNTTNYSLDSQSCINIKDLSFSYDNERQILDNINLTINPGETIGLIGPSGEGKTTVIRLLLSLIYANNGSININNEPLNTSHRQLISYVPQGNTLFSGTIRENLTLNNSNITEDEIRAALKTACALDFVENLKYKLDTVIGERGMGISEGQAQRLCIARAFLKKSPILILDESTSSLDSNTEKNILSSINNIENKPTCIIITHRPSALSICNKIYKLEDSILKETTTEKKVEIYN